MPQSRALSPFVESLLDLLRPMGGVDARRMFGGSGIYKDGLMFGLVDGEAFYLKVDDGNRMQFEEAGMEPFTVPHREGRKISLNYYRVPESALSSPLRMKPWAQSGWEAAQRKPTKTKSKPKKAGKKPQPASESELKSKPHGRPR